MPPYPTWPVSQIQCASSEATRQSPFLGFSRAHGPRVPDRPVPAHTADTPQTRAPNRRPARPQPLTHQVSDGISTADPWPWRARARCRASSATHTPTHTSWRRGSTAHCLSKGVALIRRAYAGLDEAVELRLRGFHPLPWPSSKKRWLRELLPFPCHRGFCFT